jgi:hypothetical protein
VSQPEIIRQQGPHQVELSEGGKDATHRHAMPRGEYPAPTPQAPIGRAAAPSTSAADTPLSRSAQLRAADAESPDEWPDEFQLAERLNQLRATNQRLQAALMQMNRPGH